MKLEMDETRGLKGIRKKIEEEMVKKEVEVILYWKGEIEKVMARRPESLSTFQMEVQNHVQRMQNRIRVLRNSIQE